MPHNKSTKKRVKTNELRRQRNQARRSRMRHAVRDARKAISGGEGPEVLRDKLRTTVSLLDRMVKKGLIHRNKAARLKSRLERRASATAQG